MYLNFAASYANEITISKTHVNQIDAYEVNDQNKEVFVSIHQHGNEDKRGQ